MLQSYQIHSNAYRFSKILIFDWNLKFYHWQKVPISCFPWSDRHTSFLRKFLPHSQVWWFVWHLFFHVKIMFYDCKSLACTSKNHVSAFIGDNQSALYTAEMLLHISQSHRIIKRGALKGRDLIKLIIFIVSSRTFFCETNISVVYCVSVAVKKIWLLTVQGHCLDPCSVPALMLACGKKQIMSSYYYENSFHLSDPLKGFWDPQGSENHTLRTSAIG